MDKLSQSIVAQDDDTIEPTDLVADALIDALAEKQVPSEWQPSIEEIRAHFHDRKWRLNNLYFVIDKNGKMVRFKMNAMQEYLHDNLHNRNIIPKARQLGCTTFFSILFLDQILFSENKTAGIICHKIEDQKKIFKNKIRFAWNNLHPWLRNRIGEPTVDSAYEMVFPNGGTIFTSMSTRSGTVQLLLISEFGYTCKHSPEKAEEIVTGSLNSVGADQLVVIESTSKGREGRFHDFVMEAERAQKERRVLTALDWQLFFFPWYLDPLYSLEGDVTITDEKRAYFQRLSEKTGYTLSSGQQRWYVTQEKTQRDSMFQEYPSTLDECFMVSLEGAYYAKEMDKVYSSNRISKIPIDIMSTVDSWWDLGMDDFNVIVLTQSHGPQIRFVGLYWNRGEGLAHYVKWLDEWAKEKGVRFGQHHLPHDVKVKELGTGVSRQETLYKLGMRNVRVGLKLGINEGIDRVRALFSHFYFDEESTKKLYDALREYRKDFDGKMGVFKDAPRHDESSHFADPVRLLACEWREHVPEIEGYNPQVKEQSFFG